jgi:hypothetical protein
MAKRNLLLVVFLWVLSPEARSLPLQASPPTTLSFSSYLGGNDFDRAHGCTVDAQGFVYLAMNTLSSNMPTTTGAFNRTYKGNQDAYVCKLSPDLRTLIWGTYLGGSDGDRGYGIRVDAAGFVYVTGITLSTDFPTTSGAFQTTNPTGGGVGHASIFVSKLKPDGSGLVYSTYVGGPTEGWTRGTMALDASGNLWVGGLASGPGFPVTGNAFQKTYGGGPHDEYLFKLSADGSQLLYATYFGGSGDETNAGSVFLHTDGTLYVAGTTTSTNLPVTPGAFQTVNKGSSGTRSWTGDAYVARFTPDGSALVYCTYLGGSGDDNASFDNGFLVDSSGRATLTGTTFSPDFPTTPGAYQRTYGGNGDGFVAILAADGKSLAASTYFGTSGADFTLDPGGLALDASGNVCFGGDTNSTSFPVTTNAAQKTYGGGPSDPIFAILSPDLSTLLYSTYLGGSGSGSERIQCMAFDATNHTLILSGDTGSSDFPTTAGSYSTTYNGGAGDGWVARFSPATGSPPPSITQQPASVTVTAGQTAIFTVTATGTALLSYQWQKNGANIAGATSAAYTTPATLLSDSGSTFRVVVTNSAGSVTSSSATLTVTAGAMAPTITTQPSNQTVTAGQMAAFGVVASGTAPLSYHWLKNGTNIPSATLASYTTPATTLGDSGATFQVVVTNSAGSATSSLATLTVNPSTSTLPSPWVDQDIGSPGFAGSASLWGGTFTVNGGGADIWGSSDQFNFASQPLAGDGEIIARVVGLGNTNAWAKAGVMIRETLAANSAYAFTALTPSSGAVFQHRPAAGASSVSDQGPMVVAPYWVRLVRSGNTFTSDVSPDGATWTKVGLPLLIAMAANVYIGFAVTSHDNTVTTPAMFDSVSGSGGWQPGAGNSPPPGPGAGTSGSRHRCGSVGLDLLLPLGVFWLFRRHGPRPSRLRPFGATAA